MTRTKLGMNINLGAVGNYQRLLDTARRLHSRKHLVMTDPGSGNRILDISSVLDFRRDLRDPGVQIIHRQFDARQGDWTIFNNNEMIDTWAAQLELFPESIDIIRETPINEPNIGHGDYVLGELYAEKMADLMHRGTALGLTIAAGVFGVGRPHEELVLKGVFDPILEAPGQLDLHEYAYIWPEAGIPGHPYEILLDVGTLTQHRLSAWPYPGEYYLLRRGDFWDKRSALLQLPAKIKVITESYLDNINDAGNIGELLRNPYGLPEYNETFGGFSSLERYYAAVYPGVDPNLVFFWLTQHVIENVYAPDTYDAVINFAWNRLWGVDYARGFDTSMASRVRFWNLCIEYFNSEPDPPIEPPTEPPMPQLPNDFPLPGDPAWIVATAKSESSSGANVRYGPSIDDAIAGILYADFIEIRYIADHQRWIYNQGYVWIPFSSIDGAVLGYIAASVVIWEQPHPLAEVPVDPPTEPEDPDVPDSNHLTGDEYEALQELLKPEIEYWVDLMLPNLTITYTDSNREMQKQLFKNMAVIFNAMYLALDNPSPANITTEDSIGDTS